MEKDKKRKKGHGPELDGIKLQIFKPKTQTRKHLLTA